MANVCFISFYVYNMDDDTANAAAAAADDDDQEPINFNVFSTQKLDYSSAI